MPSVFVAYDRRDSHFVDSLVEQLKLLGVAVSMDRVDFVPGRRLEGEIRDRLFSSDALVPVISRHSAESHWVSFEVGLAKSDDHIIVIPVVLEGAQLHEVLSDRLFVAADDQSKAAAVKAAKEISEALSSHLPAGKRRRPKWLGHLRRAAWTIAGLLPVAALSWGAGWVGAEARHPLGDPLISKSATGQFRLLVGAQRSARQQFAAYERALKAQLAHWTEAKDSSVRFWQTTPDEACICEVNAQGPMPLCFGLDVSVASCAYRNQVLAYWRKGMGDTVRTRLPWQHDEPSAHCRYAESKVKEEIFCFPIAPDPEGVDGPPVGIACVENGQRSAGLQRASVQIHTYIMAQPAALLPWAEVKAQMVCERAR